MYLRGIETQFNREEWNNDIAEDGGLSIFSQKLRLVGAKPKRKGINSNAKIHKLEENLKEKDVEIIKLVDRVDYLTSRLENQERVWMIAWQIKKKFGRLALNAKRRCLICFSLQMVVHQLIFLRKIW